MRRVSALWSLAVLAICHAGVVFGIDDVQILINLKHSSYLRFEPLLVDVQITNMGEVPLSLGTTDWRNSWVLDFEVWEAEEKIPKRRLTRRPCLSDQTLAVEETRSFIIDLTEFYNMFTEGNYRFRCVLKSAESRLMSRIIAVDVVRGIELKKVERSLPGYAGMPRVYSLRYWRRGGRDRLFLVVDAPSERMNYGVFDLGQLLRIENPAIEVTRDGDVTVRHMSGNDVFVVSKLRSERDGVSMTDQRYFRRDGRPHRLPTASQEVEQALEQWRLDDETVFELRGWWLLDVVPAD